VQEDDLTYTSSVCATFLQNCRAFAETPVVGLLDQGVRADGLAAGNPSAVIQSKYGTENIVHFSDGYEGKDSYYAEL
jgi:activator of 2-hydroxyglutaryl-CoA dehydratase